jgi:autotransporter-associated beta strand protein
MIPIQLRMNRSPRSHPSIARRTYAAFLVSFLLIFSVTPAFLTTVHAANLTWNNGAATGNWNTTDANWTGSTWNNSAPDHAIFNTTTDTITLTETISAGSFTFGVTNANTTGTFTGSALAISGNLVAQADGNNYPAINPTLTFSNHVTVTGDVQLGRRNLDISGGTFTANRLVSNGSWGRLRVNGGSVTITNGIDDSILPAGNTMSVVLQSGSLHTPYIKTTNNWGIPDGDGVYFNGGTLFATANSNDFIQTYTFVGNKNEVAVGTGGAKINTNGFDITITKSMKNSGGAGALTKSGAGTLKLTAYNEYTGGTTIHAGTLVVENAGTLGSGNVTVNAAAICEIRNPSGAIDDFASIYLNGTGKLTIAAGVTEVVSGLSIDGVPQGAGSYNATSLASHIAGGGSLQVLEGTVSLTTPRARQIIQRSGSNTASIVISGTYTGMPEHIEARAVIMAGSGNHGTSTDWTTIVPSPAGGTFSGSLSGVAAGGWYQIEVRSVSGGTATSNIAIVQRVGVGDVYLTAGQSNSANYGEPSNNTDDRVSAMDFSTGAWTLASDPMPGADGSTGSVWTRLGPLLTSAENVPVGFVCVGIGGSMVSQWVPPSSEGYVKLKAAAQAFPASGFRAVLWHQGESDSLASTTPADYQTRLQSIIAQVRTDSGWTMPWYVAEASFHPASTLVQEEPVVAGQRRVMHADPLVFAGPATDDFHREGKLFDTVHFNAAGLTDHAQQWAELLAGTPPLAAKNGNLESNSALADGGISVVNMSDVSSSSVIGWRILNASGEAVADGGNGYFNPDASFYADAVDGGASGGVLPNMSGRHVAFLYAGSDGNHFLQTRRATLQANASYTLTVALGVRGNGNAYGNARIELLADGTSIASREITLADLNALNGGNAANKFTDVQLTYTSGTMVASGQPLSIRITKIIGENSGNPTYLDFDNVRLTSSLTDYGGWANFHGIADDQTGDDDHDGMNNFAEYVFGTDPKNGSSVQPIILPVNPATGILTYTRRRQALTGLPYTVWFSTDLQTEWTQDSGAVQTITGTSGDVETIQVTLSSSLLSHPRLFVRISSAQ